MPNETLTFRGLTLNAFQREAVAAINDERDVIVSAPTGAGKTLVAEYAIEQCLAQGRRAIYTAPIKALSNQKYRDFQELGNATVGIMTGDVTIRPKADILIMTTEIFRNAIFDRGPELEDVRYVVFDEIHYMDDRERGTVWEESIIFGPEHVRVLGLSATVSNLREFCDWISGVRESEVVRVQSRERPVPLLHYLHFPDYGPRRADKVKQLPKPKSPPTKKKKQRGRGPRRSGGRSRADALLDRLQREDRLPVLFFCFSRRECEIRARENQERQLLQVDQRQRIEQLFDEICARFEVTPDSSIEELRNLAYAGIGYHHAGLLPLHKELVERLFTSGLLRLLFTTETFALGINMPARTVVFSSLRKFDGVSFDMMRARDYQQMAGRAGRQGIDTEGLVYSIIDDDRARIDDVRRPIFGGIEPIRSRFSLSYSSLLNLHEHLGEKVFEAWEKSFNNYQWRRMSRKKREQNEKRQRQAIAARLHLLRELGYIDGEQLTAKGEAARRINGYELPAVELIDSGLFRAMSDVQIAVILAAVVYESRKRDLFRRMPNSLLGHLKGDSERVIHRLVRRERELGVQPETRQMDFAMGRVVKTWWDGGDFAEIDTLTNASHGDVVRTFRLVIQLLRQLARAYSADEELEGTLMRVLEKMNRDEVDARRQMELGDPRRTRTTGSDAETS